MTADELRLVQVEYAPWASYLESRGETPLPYTRVNFGVGSASAKGGLAQDGFSSQVDLPPPKTHRCEPLAYGYALREMMRNAFWGAGSVVSESKTEGWMERERERQRTCPSHLLRELFLGSGAYTRSKKP